MIFSLKLFSKRVPECAYTILFDDVNITIYQPQNNLIFPKASCLFFIEDDIKMIIIFDEEHSIEFCKGQRHKITLSGSTAYSDLCEYDDLKQLLNYYFNNDARKIVDTTFAE